MIAKLVVCTACFSIYFLEELKCALIGRNCKFDQSEHTSTLVKKVNTKKDVEAAKRHFRTLFMDQNIIK